MKGAFSILSWFLSLHEKSLPAYGRCLAEKYRTNEIRLFVVCNQDIANRSQSGLIWTKKK
ncbi:hypothetical protein I7I48_04407 [Histoplasma ohiense]|nr:hypothetical protein I7I48_04407 [Histoplasma ohiense (nom. inval.)]